MCARGRYVVNTARPSSPATPASTAARIRNRALTRLRQNVKRQNFVPTEGNPAYAQVNGRKTILPAYIPYVGQRYFHYRPRVLCYAINQNLSRHTRWTDEWTTKWGTDSSIAIDRLNRAAVNGEAIPIKPYVEGFIPLAALLAIMRYGQTFRAALPNLVDDVLAVTNFVKFSTADDASSSSIPSSWWQECAERYVTQEIRELKPDLLVAFGLRTASGLHRTIGDSSFETQRPELLVCKFPARIPSVSSRPLSEDEQRVWNDHILPLVSRIRPPSENAHHRSRILRFPGYFIDIVRGWLPALF